MSLPPVSPDVLAEAVDALPARLRKRLDEVVDQARGWPVESTPDGVVVTVDDQRVRLAARVLTADDAVCSCLLAPRCLHRTALLAAAPVLADEPETASDPTASAGPPPPREASLRDLPPGSAPNGAGLADLPPAPGWDEASLTAAAALWRAATPVLETGIPGAGAVAQAQLLRAVHEARGAGLPRAAAAGVRVVEGLRLARTGEARFRLADLTDDLRELLTVCHQITAGQGDPAQARGVSRREYEEVGSRRLWGLFTEPVLTASGYAGAATYLSDEDGRLWTISDVRPGGLADARGAADGPVSLGEVRLSHREAGRAGFVVTGARAAANGRLSAGASVQAVRTAGRGWTEEPLARHWDAPLGEQVARYRDSLAGPAPIRPAGYDLVFLQGALRTSHSGLALDVPGVGAVEVLAPVADPGLPAVANLRQLARAAAGQLARLIGRFAGTRSVRGLALAAPWLPDRLDGHIDLSVDVLQRSDLPGSTDPSPVEVTASDVGTPESLQLLRLRVERAVSGGRAAVRTPSAGEAIRLAAANLPYAATVLIGLQEAADRRTRDVFGRLDQLDSDRLAKAWLAAAIYCGAAQRHLATAGWLA
jgi:hypothetical protein